MSNRLVAGCMSGTSIDGIDVALVEISGRGLDLVPRFIRGHSVGLGNLAAPLRSVAGQRPHTAGQITHLAHAFAELHNEALAALLANERPDLIAIHGQTVFHQPPFSWQLLNAAPVAARFHAPVVFDMRAMDLAHGGQGAPITPLADWLLFRDKTSSRVVANLGGFCNLTYLPKDGGLSGKDVCACNQILDEVARHALKESYDEGGQRAAAGKSIPAAFVELRKHLQEQAAGKRSLGTGDELTGLIKKFAAHLQPEDLARSACAAIAQTIADYARPTDLLILAGGGVHNRTLVAELTQRTGCTVRPSDELGLPSSYREAAEMAVLGALCQDRVPITLSAVTGVPRPPIAGTWILP